MNFNKRTQIDLTRASSSEGSSRTDIYKFVEISFIAERISLESEVRWSRQTSERASKQASRQADTVHRPDLATSRCAARADPATPLAYYVTPGNVAGIHREGVGREYRRGGYGRARRITRGAGRDTYTGREGIMYDRDTRAHVYTYILHGYVRARVHCVHTCVRVCVCTCHGIPHLSCALCVTLQPPCP